MSQFYQLYLIAEAGWILYFTNSSIKGTIGCIIVFNHSQGHKNEGVGTNVSEKLYSEAGNAFKRDLQLQKWSSKW